MRGELEQLFSLYTHYTAEENRPALSAERLEKIWREIELNPGVHYFVSELDNRLTAACILTITPSIIRGGMGYGLIEHVVTHQDFRRRGIAKRLMEYVLDFAWTQECTEVMLLSGHDLGPAHAMYENLDFDKEQRTGFIKFRPPNYKP